MATTLLLLLLMTPPPTTAQPLALVPPPVTSAVDTLPQDERPLTRAEEKALLIQMRRSRGWDLEALARRDLMEQTLGRGRVRRLDEARFHYQLYQGEPHFEDAWRDPEFFDRKVEREVLSAYKKLARESLEDALGLEAWWDAKRERYRARRSSHRQESPSNPWRVRVDPRLSNDSVGFALRLPSTGLHLFNHLQARVRWELEEDRPTFTLRFDDDDRYLNLDLEPQTEDFGDQLRLSIRLAW